MNLGVISWPKNVSSASRQPLFASREDIREAFEYCEGIFEEEQGFRRGQSDCLVSGVSAVAIEEGEGYSNTSMLSDRLVRQIEV